MTIDRNGSWGVRCGMGAGGRFGIGERAIRESCEMNAENEHGQKSLKEKYRLEQVVASKANFDEDSDWVAILRKDPYRIGEISKKKQTEDMVIAALCESDPCWRTLIDLRSRNISQRFKKPEFAAAICQREPTNILFVPDSLRTAKLARTVMKLPGGGYALAILPQSCIDAMSDEDVANALYNTNGIYLDRIPKTCLKGQKSRDAYDCMQSAGAERFLQWQRALPNRSMAESSLPETLEIRPVNFSHKLIEERIQNVLSVIKPPLTTALAAIPPSDATVFVNYISDVHLEWRIVHGGMRYMSRGKISEAIAVVVDEIVESIGRGRSMILIGGDVADDPALVDEFYRALGNRIRKDRLGCPVFAVMGNHEIRHMPESEFAAMCKRHGIVPLVDSLYVFYKGAKGVVLDGRDILDCDRGELREVLAKAEYAILGGTGFAGKNGFFNADAGLYLDALSRNAEKERSARFDKLASMLRGIDGASLVVLTHNPIEDWNESESTLPAATYVSGHTHRNGFYKVAGNLVLANAQIGRPRFHRPMKCKRFVLRRNILRPLEGLGDGVHHISRDDYLLFTRERMSGSDFSRDGEIYLVRSGRYRMFLLDSGKRISILNCGQVMHSPSRDLGYYERNLANYAAAVGKRLKRLDHDRCAIAEMVRASGGTGTTHGLIIDYDFLNHIFWNPNDGSVHCYYAPAIGYERFYPSFSEMLRELGAIKREIESAASLDSLCVSQGSPDSETVSSFRRMSNLVIRLERIELNGVVTDWVPGVLETDSGNALFATALPEAVTTQPEDAEYLPETDALLD